MMVLGDDKDDRGDEMMKLRMLMMTKKNMMMMMMMMCDAAGTHKCRKNTQNHTVYGTHCCDPGSLILTACCYKSCMASVYYRIGHCPIQDQLRQWVLGVRRPLDA